MKSKLFPIILALSLTPALSLAANDQSTTTTDNTNVTSTQTTQPDAATLKQAGEVLQTLIVIDDNEINIAQVAQKQATDSNVKDFAQTMITDHTKNKEDAKALGQQINANPVSSEKTDLLAKQGKEELKTLQAKQGKEFDVAYIDAMVKGHTLVLQLINDKLLPNASNPDLIKFLKATQDTVSHHLEMAKDVKNKLASPAAS